MLLVVCKTQTLSRQPGAGLRRHRGFGRGASQSLPEVGPQGRRRTTTRMPRRVRQSIRTAKSAFCQPDLLLFSRLKLSRD